MSKKLRESLRKTIAGLVAISTIMSLSGVMALAPQAAQAATTIVDGSLIQNPAATGDAKFDVYVVKIVGTEKYKRLILNPTIFNSYGSLFKWSDIKSVDQATMDSYTTSALVRIETNPQVYALAPAGDSGSKSWMNVSADTFIAAGGKWNSVYVINTIDGTTYTAAGDLTTQAQVTTFLTTGVLPGVVPVGTGLSVAVAGTDPATKAAAMGAQDVVFSTVKVTAGATNVTVSSVEVARGLIGDGGIAADGNFTNVKLFKETVASANKMGSTLTLNTTTHTAKFTNLNWTINAGQTDTLVITGSLATTGITGNVLMLGLRSASAVTLTGTETVSGTFPAFGSKISPATTAVGQFDLDILATPADASPLSGSTDQHVATLQFESETEDFRLDSVKITQIGSATPSDLSNITLKYGTVVLATIPALASNNTGTFNIVAPASENIIKAGNTRNFNVYVDIAGGITTSRTIDISVQQSSDVVAVGQTSGGTATLLSTVAGDGTAYSVDSGAAQTIAQGSISTSISAAYNPSASNYVKGTTDRKITALRFSASNSEAVRVTQLTLTESGTSADSDVSSVKLAEVGAGGVIGATLATGTLSSGTVQLGTNDINAYDSDYLFEVPKGGNKDVYVLADIPTGAGSTTIILSVAAATDVKADGVSSQNDIPTASITGTATGNTMTITANGTVTISAGSTTAAATYVKGAQDKEFARFTFTADDGEDITISAVNLLAVTSGNVALSTANSPTDVRIYKDSVVSANLLGTVSSPATGVANFSFTDVITAGTVRTYIVTGDIPTTSGATTISMEIDAEADVTALGNSSGITGTAVTSGTFSVQGNDMTVAQGTLGVIASSLPVYTNVTEKSNNTEVARFVLASASNGETIRVNSLKVTLKGLTLTDGLYVGASSKSVNAADISQITLYDVNGGDIAAGGVKTKTIGSLTATSATFSGLAIDVASGSQKIIGVKVNIGDSSLTTPNIVMGIDNYYTDVAATGLDSGSTVYANQLVHGTSGVLATLFAAFVLADLDMTAAVTDADDELSDYGVPALGITAAAAALDNAVITVDTEDMLINDASASTLRADVTTATDRAGWGGTTAAAHSTTGVPIILKVAATNTVSSASNNFSTNSNTSIVAATTVASAMHAGQLVVQHDANVDNGEDDIKLITAVASDGLTVTEVDAYAGTAFAEDTGNDQFVTAMTNYGQAQVVQAVGTLSLAVASGTPVAGQVVAGATGVEFSRVKLTSQYEPIKITKLVFTKTGDATVANHVGAGSDSDFASVYLQNLTDSTWGPNGNGKTNTTTLVGGVVTFNLDDTNAITVDHNAVSGVELALKGNLNTVTTGVTSGDAPKFYIASLADSNTNITAKGGSTGTTLTTFTAGTPTPATATNFNAQTIYKGTLTLALNSGSLSGTQTRSANQTILKLDATSNSTGSVATFRAGTVNEATATTTDFSPTPAGSDTDGDWAVVTVGDDGSTGAASATNRIGGSGNSMLFTQGATTPAAGNGLTYAGVNLDLSDYTGMAFWMRTSQVADNYTITMTGATAGSHTITTSGYEAGHWYFVDVPFSDATTPFTGLTAVTAWNILTATAAADTDTLNIDKLYFYTDKLKVNLASNGSATLGLAANDTADYNVSADLKDGGTTLATAWYSGNASSTALHEHSAGNLTFIPTSQFTIPTAGRTLSVVADTSALIRLTASTLSMTIGLGSADSNGLVTDGDVFFWDESFNLSDNSIRWANATTNPIQSSTITY